MLLVEIKEAGGTIVSVHENIDITTADGKMMFDFRMAMAENYLTRSREKWEDAQRHAVEKGIYTENFVPPGLEKREDRRLYHGPDAPIIKEAWQKRIAREPTQRITAFLNKRLPLPEGRLWIDSTVERMFAKRIYRGELSRRGVTNRNACEPLVTEAECAGRTDHEQHEDEAAGQARQESVGRHHPMRELSLRDDRLKCAGQKGRQEAHHPRVPLPTGPCARSLLRTEQHHAQEHRALR